MNKDLHRTKIVHFYREEFLKHKRRLESQKDFYSEKTFQELQGSMGFAVIEGDVQTDRDARRIESLGVPVVQSNVGHDLVYQVGEGSEDSPTTSFPFSCAGRLVRARPRICVAS